MGASRLTVVLVALAIIFVGGAAVIDAGLRGAGPETQVEDEEFTPVGGDTIALEFSNLENTRYSLTVTVTDNQDNVFPEDGNYTWHDSNGTITVNATGDLASENTAFIDYNYTEAVDEAVNMVDTYSILADNAQPALLLVVGVAVLLTAVRVFGGAGF